MFFIGSSFRRTLHTDFNRFPWQMWVRLVYNDALTFNAANGQGGVKASWRFREFARDPLNKDMQHFAVFLQNMKAQEGVPFDKLSLADYAVAAAFTTIQEAGGPVMLDDFVFGRKDAKNAGECGSVKNVPSESNYVSHLTNLGFSEKEIVALASVESFGIHRDPKQSRWSSHPKFETYFYKQLLTSADHMPHKEALLGTASLKETVEQFAENKAEYDKSFKAAFVKLCDLGHSSTSLIDVEHFLHDDPSFKLRFPMEANLGQ
jgi:catalase (peroxidase I)